MEYRIGAEDGGKTVGEFARHVAGLSAATVRHLKFTENGITVNGNHVTVRYLLSCGELLSLAFEDTEPQERLAPVELPLAIAYEDSELVLPDKPAEMPTHPSHGHYDDTVANALAFRYAATGIPFVFRPINRLDRNTSGLLMIARNRRAAATLSAHMREGRIRKQYLAVLEGTPPKEEGVIETYLRRTANSVILRENCREGEGGDYARTLYRVLVQNGHHSVCLASPETGRTHQLRVHFAGVGAPIVGDDLYGTCSPLIPRHALHAASLTFPHPTDGRSVRVTAPLHGDMQALIQALFSEAEIRQAQDACASLGIPFFDRNEE